MQSQNDWYGMTIYLEETQAFSIEQAQAMLVNSAN